jgi:CheY-like chemotaxis protein
MTNDAPKKNLLIEDEEIVRDMFVVMLEDEGFKVHIAVNDFKRFNTIL